MAPGIHRMVHADAAKRLCRERTASGSQVTATMRQVIEQFGEYAKLNKKLGEGAGDELGDIDDAGELADTIAALSTPSTTVLIASPDVT